MIRTGTSCRSSVPDRDEGKAGWITGRVETIGKRPFRRGGFRELSQDHGMSTVEVHENELRLRLTRLERLLALHGDVTVPWPAVTGVEVVPDAYIAVLGLRAPGLALPGRRLLGTWRTPRGPEFVDVTGHVPGVRLALRHQPFVSLLVSSADADALAAMVAQHL
jgi:hypothetical protein